MQETSLSLSHNSVESIKQVHPMLGKERRREGEQWRDGEQELCVFWLILRPGSCWCVAEFTFLTHDKGANNHFIIQSHILCISFPSKASLTVNTYCFAPIKLSLSGTYCNSASACFVASDGTNLRLYQAVVDARKLLDELSDPETSVSPPGELLPPPLPICSPLQMKNTHPPVSPPPLRSLLARCSTLSASSPPPGLAASLSLTPSPIR